MNPYLEKLLETGNSLMIYKDSRLLFQSRSKGVAPHIEAIQTLGDQLRGSTVVDKLVGKAAALLILYEGAGEAVVDVVSSLGRQVLEARGLRLVYREEVPHIKTREGVVFCPFERAVQGVEDPEEAYKVVLETLEGLRGR